MRYLPAVVVDVVLVLVFAVIGRASHNENAAGFLLTAWPFLVALLLGHAIAALLPGRPRRPWSVLWGLVVWVITVIGGMLLRIATGDTAQVAFIIVATLTLGVFLVGWRALTALLRRRRAAAVADAQDDLPGRLESEERTDAEASVSRAPDVDEQPSDPDRPAS
jgi:drug/metabolite transporter (DMT)-like permease